MAETAVRRPIRERLEERKAKARERIITACVASGANAVEARDVLEELESDRPLLDWLASSGFEIIIALILRLLGLAL